MALQLGSPNMSTAQNQGINAFGDPGGGVNDIFRDIEPLTLKPNSFTYLILQEIGLVQAAATN